MSYITWNWVVSRRFSRINETVLILNEKKNRDFIRLSVCMLVSIVSAFLLVPSLYVTSPTTTYCAIPILSLPASMELMAVSIFIFFNYKVSRVGEWSGLRQGKILYDLDTAIALYGTLLHSVIYRWLVYWTITIYIAGSIKIALSIRNSPRSIN